MPSPRAAGLILVRSRPPRLIIPALGSTKPAIICSVVVLPQPDGPRRDTNSPFSTPSESPSTTVTSPKRFVRDWSTRNDILAPFWRVPLWRAAPPMSALDLASPALVPVFACRVDHIPIDRDELLHVVAIRQPDAFFGLQVNGLVGRSEPRAFGQRDLDLGREQELHEGVRLRGI